MKNIQFPENKKFAFTVLDDTDNAKIETIKPVYDLLLQLKMKTTKTVWVYPTTDVENPFYQSQTLMDQQYLDFIRFLDENGFEIAFHGASMDSSLRHVTISALNKFNELLGFYPNIHINHSLNKENIYWGFERLDLPVLRYIMKFKRRAFKFVGHHPNSPFFWGDICQKHIRYVRNLVFNQINLLKLNPTLPYKDPNRPFVKYWFSSSNGRSVNIFNKLLSIKNQKRLEREGGVCILYTHFAEGFTQNGKLNPETKELLVELSERNGWFVPVSRLLDYLCERQVESIRTPSERFKMEIVWFFTKILYGPS